MDLTTNEHFRAFVVRCGYCVKQDSPRAMLAGVPRGDLDQHAIVLVHKVVCHDAHRRQARGLGTEYVYCELQDLVEALLLLSAGPDALRIAEKQLAEQAARQAEYERYRRDSARRRRARPRPPEPEPEHDLPPEAA